jgi:hypothetical protein
MVEVELRSRQPTPNKITYFLTPTYSENGSSILCSFVHFVLEGVPLGLGSREATSPGGGSKIRRSGAAAVKGKKVPLHSLTDLHNSDSTPHYTN